MISEQCVLGSPRGVSIVGNRHLVANIGVGVHASHPYPNESLGFFCEGRKGNGKGVKGSTPFTLPDELTAALHTTWLLHYLLHYLLQRRHR
jgi:hypothetical protein